AVRPDRAHDPEGSRPARHPHHRTDVNCQKSEARQEGSFCPLSSSLLCALCATVVQSLRNNLSGVIGRSTTPLPLARSTALGTPAATPTSDSSASPFAPIGLALASTAST